MPSGRPSRTSCGTAVAYTWACIPRCRGGGRERSARRRALLADGIGPGMQCKAEKVAGVECAASSLTEQISLDPAKLPNNKAPH